MQQLANDPPEPIRWAVACHEHTPIATLEPLGCESDRAMKEALLNNRNLPNDLIEPLVQEAEI